MSNNKQTNTVILIVAVIAAVIIAVGFATHGFGLHHGSYMGNDTAMTDMTK